MCGFFIDTVNSETGHIDIFNKNEIIKEYMKFRKNENSSSFALFNILTSLIFIKKFSKIYE